MPIENCQQSTLDNNWTLERTNACHISNMNDELGGVQRIQLEMSLKLNAILWILTIISAIVIAVVTKKLLSVIIKK